MGAFAEDCCPIAKLFAIKMSIYCVHLPPENDFRDKPNLANIHGHFAEDCCPITKLFAIKMSIYCVHLPPENDFPDKPKLANIHGHVAEDCLSNSQVICNTMSIYCVHFASMKMIFLWEIILIHQWHAHMLLHVMPTFWLVIQEDNLEVVGSGFFENACVQSDIISPKEEKGMHV